MASVILCEGSSDAILLGYFLIHCGSWEHCDNDRGPFSVNLANPENQEFNWYRRGENFVAIWGVGGTSMFNDAVNQIAEINRTTEKGLGAERIFILTDRDNCANDQPIIETFDGYFRNAGIQISLESRIWKMTTCLDAYHESREIHIAIVVVPFERRGALETFVLDAISEEDDDEEIVNAVRMIIADLRTSKYLMHDRQRVKAELAATLGIMHPTRLFKPINSILSNIPWEKYTTIQTGFALLNDL